MHEGEIVVKFIWTYQGFLFFFLLVAIRFTAPSGIPRNENYSLRFMLLLWEPCMA